MRMRPRERGGAGTHSLLRLGQSAAAGSAASSVLSANLRAQPCGRAGRLRPTANARRSAARASHACAGLGRRPTTGNAAAAAANAARLGPSARRGSATRSSAAAGTAAHAHGGGGGGRGTHRYSKSVHWPSHSGSASTFVPTMYLPRTARACGPRPPRTDGRTWGRTGRSHGKSLRMP